MVNFNIHWMLLYAEQVVRYLLEILTVKLPIFLEYELITKRK